MRSSVWSVLFSFSPAGSVAPLFHLYSGGRGSGTRYAGSTFNTTIVTPVATISHVCEWHARFPAIYPLFFIRYLITDFVVFFFVSRLFLLFFSFKFLVPRVSSDFRFSPSLMVLAAAVVFIYSSIPLRSSLFDTYLYIIMCNVPLKT